MTGGIHESQSDWIKRRTSKHCVSSFFYPIYAAALLEVWALRVGAGIIVHTYIAVTFLAFAAAEYLRYRRTRSLNFHPKAAQTQRLTKRTAILAVCRFMFMLAAGYVFGQLVLVGLLTLMLIFAVGLQFLPWSRMCASRRDFYAAGVLMAVGAAYSIVTAETLGNQMSFPWAAVALWTCAVVATLRRWETETKRNQRP